MIRIMIADDHALMRRVVREVFEKESDLEIVAEACNGHEAELQAAQTQPDIVLMDLDMPDRDGFESTERVLARAPHARIIIFTAFKQEQYALQAISRGAIGYLTKDIEPDALVRAIRSAVRDEICMSRPLAARVLAHLRSAGQRQGSISGGSRDTQPQERTSKEMLSPSPAGQLPQATSASRPPFALHYKISFDGGQTGRWESQLPPQADYSLREQNSQLSLPDERMRLLTEREREVLDLMRKGLKNREIAHELGIAESTVHKHVQNIFDKLKARNRTEAIYLTHANA